MLYGWQTTDKVFVGAADTIKELKAFHGRTVEAPTKIEITPVADLRGSGTLTGFLVVLAVVTFADEDAAGLFVRDEPVAILTPSEVRDHQIRLVKAMKTVDRTIARPCTIKETLGFATDPLAAKIAVVEAEDAALILGVDGKFADKAQVHTDDIRRAEEEARRIGQIKTEDYVVFAASAANLFGDGVIETVAYFVSKRRAFEANDLAKPCPDALLTELPPTIIRLAEGIHYCRAMSPSEAILLLTGLHYVHDQTVREVFDPSWTPKQRGLELSSDRGSSFYRIDVQGATLLQLEALWDNEDWTYANNAAGFGEIDGVPWYAYPEKSRSVAERFRDRIERRGFVVPPIHLVNVLHDPVAPLVVEQTAVEPRPWNAKADLLAKFTAEQLAANRRGYKTREFLFARIANGIPPGEVRMVVAPACVFKETNGLFAGPLDIGDLLPSYTKEIEPGIYATTRADWATLEHEMSKQRGFVRSMVFDLFAKRL